MMLPSISYPIPLIRRMTSSACCHSTFTSRTVTFPVTSPPAKTPSRLVSQVNSSVRMVPQRVSSTPWIAAVSGVWPMASGSKPSIRAGGSSDDEGGPGDSPASVAWLRRAAERDRLKPLEERWTAEKGLVDQILELRAKLRGLGIDD